MLRLKPSQSKSFLPYGRQCIDEDDIEAVTAVLKGDWLTGGPAVAAFEGALARTTGAQHAMSCSNGTAALHLAALALGLNSGSTVIVPTVTFVATANAARFTDANVVFADVDPNTGLMTQATLEEAIGRVPGNRPDAIFNVHLNGQCADVEAIFQTAQALQSPVVEDACHAIGTRYRTKDKGIRTVGDGQHADLSVFSFHPVKTIAMGEGGAITTRDEALAARLRQFREHGLVRDSASFIDEDISFDAQGEPNPWSYEMQSLGFNYRANDLQCALGASQLRKLDHFVNSRQSLVTVYREKLRPYEDLLRPVSLTPDVRAAWHLFVVLIDFDKAGVSRAELMRSLRSLGIGTQVHYLPVHMQPYYKELCSTDFKLPGAQRYYERCLSLPLHVNMTEEDVEFVVSALLRELGA